MYAAANATFEFLHLSYIVSEMHNIDFPKPIFTLEMDNSTAECFANNSAFKSRLKHIDTRQHWVKVLRDKNILIPQHIDTKDNLADFFHQSVVQRHLPDVVLSADGLCEIGLVSTEEAILDTAPASLDDKVVYLLCPL